MYCMYYCIVFREYIVFAVYSDTYYIYNYTIVYTESESVRVTLTSKSYVYEK